MISLLLLASTPRQKGKDKEEKNSASLAQKVSGGMWSDAGMRRSVFRVEIGYARAVVDQCGPVWDVVVRCGALCFVVGCCRLG